MSKLLKKEVSSEVPKSLKENAHQAKSTLTASQEKKKIWKE